MNLLQVRKGQFVYYRNELHQVYSVKSMFRKSVHLYRLKDMQQTLTQASNIQFHKPEHMESFIFYGRRYTIDKDKIPNKGDYILIIKPTPEFLDHYALNAIEKVEQIENDYVLTAKDNGVRHHEYVVLVPEKTEGSLDIAYFNRDLVSEKQQQIDESSDVLQVYDTWLRPAIGDIYFDNESNMTAMIVAMTENEVTFGHGVRLTVGRLIHEDRYTFMYRAEEEL